MTTDQPPAPAFPFVGARAQVTVAEWTYEGETETCPNFEVGDIVKAAEQSTQDDDWWCLREADGVGGYVAARHLRPVSVSPGPDQPTEHEQPWRQVGALVWTGRDGVVMAEHPEDAARAVAAVNAEAGLRAEVQRLRDEVERGTSLLRTSTHLVRVTEDERDAARAELDAATTDGLGLPQVKVVRGQNSDGTKGAWLTLVADWEKHYAIDDAEPLWLLRERAAVALALVRDAVARDRAASADDDEARAIYASLHGGDYWDAAEESSRAQYRDAAAAGRAAAAERARLADEATTDDKETGR